ncbi:hypothetical protein PUV47_16440 [Pseudovibrio exalbescens]|uniref:hypothetical protein n=1 Tax=Pseudovibrio exalbescens TaxID=197461 RepID=UPI002366B400|nr:hypothetical protein [Pseudovibrio exalbescens]MDD7911521.1 hypothetical protein [Pseudovibrio exalbescens]
MRSLNAFTRLVVSGLVFLTPALAQSANKSIVVCERDWLGDVGFTLSNNLWFDDEIGITQVYRHKEKRTDKTNARRYRGFRFSLLNMTSVDLGKYAIYSVSIQDTGLNVPFYTWNTYKGNIDGLNFEEDISYDILVAPDNYYSDYLASTEVSAEMTQHFGDEQCKILRTVSGFEIEKTAIFVSDEDDTNYIQCLMAGVGIHYGLSNYANIIQWIDLPSVTIGDFHPPMWFKLRPLNVLYADFVSYGMGQEEFFKKISQVNCSD